MRSCLVVMFVFLLSVPGFAQLKGKCFLKARHAAIPIHMIWSERSQRAIRRMTHFLKDGDVEAAEALRESLGIKIPEKYDAGVFLVPPKLTSLSPSEASVIGKRLWFIRFWGSTRIYYADPDSVYCKANR